jgi:hypothetical protein
MGFFPALIAVSILFLATKEDKVFGADILTISNRSGI